MMMQIASPNVLLDSYLDDDRLRLMRIRPVSDSMHRHDFFELVYVMEGSALHQLGADTFRVQAGDYFIVDFGSFHRYQDTDGFVIINCIFSPEFVDRALINSPSLSALLSSEIRQFGAPVHGVRPADRLYRDEDGRIRRLFEEMVWEYSERPVGYLEMIRSHVIEVLVHTLRAASASEVSRQIHPAVASMSEYLYEHFAEPLSLEVFSSRLGYTPQYLSALFRRETGMSLSAFLQRVRVEKSCRMLMESRMAISQIAQKVGYCDLKHFNSVFRRYIGLSPREYRSRVSVGTGRSASDEARERSDSAEGSVTHAAPKS